MNSSLIKILRISGCLAAILICGYSFVAIFSFLLLSMDGYQPDTNSLIFNLSYYTSIPVFVFCFVYTILHLMELSTTKTKRIDNKNAKKASAFGILWKTIVLLLCLNCIFFISTAYFNFQNQHRVLICGWLTDLITIYLPFIISTTWIVIRTLKIIGQQINMLKNIVRQ